MRCFGQVEHEHLVGNRLTDGTGEFHLRLLEFLRVKYRFHRHNRRFSIRNLNTDSALARNRGDDTDAKGREAQGDIILEGAHLGNTDTGRQRDLVKRDGRTDRGLDAGDLDTKGTEHLHDAVLVGGLLSHIDERLAVIVVFLQEVECRIVVVLKVTLGIVGFEVLQIRRNGLGIGRILILSHLDLHADFLALRLLDVVGGLHSRCCWLFLALIDIIYHNSLSIVVELNRL